MRLTALDIRKQEFKKVMRGYDPLEVEAFLDMVADEYEGLARMNSELTEKIFKLEERVQEFEKIESMLKKTLMEAQHSKDRSKVSSIKEADIVIKEAELKADRLMDEARRDMARLKGEISMLQSKKKMIASRLKQLLSSNLELIKVLEAEDEDIEKIKQISDRAKDESRKAPPVSKPPVSPRMPHPKPGAAFAVPSSRQPMAEERKEPVKPQVEKEIETKPKQEPEPVSKKINTKSLIDRMILEHEEEEETQSQKKKEDKE